MSLTYRLMKLLEEKFWGTLSQYSKSEKHIKYHQIPNINHTHPISLLLLVFHKTLLKLRSRPRKESPDEAPGFLEMVRSDYFNLG